MCFNDWRVGRLIRTTGRALLIGDAQTLILPPRPTRVGLLIGCLDTAGGFTGSVKLTRTGTTEVLAILPSPVSPHMFSLALHGDLPTLGITLLTAGVPTTIVSVTEFEATEDMLSVGLEQFNTEYGRRLN